MTLTVRTITPGEHAAYLEGRAVSFLQMPGWARVRPRWTPERVGWFDGDRLVGVALVMLLRVPLVPAALAHVAEGPVLGWQGMGTAQWLPPLTEHLRRRGAAVVRLAPPEPLHRWDAETVKAAVGPGRRLADVPPDETPAPAARLVADLTAAGWRRAGEGASPWPRHSFRVDLTGRTPEELRRSLNRQWRRALVRAEAAGVEVVRATAADLPAFSRVYAETAARDLFDPHPLDFFERLHRGLEEDGEGRARLYLARLDGEVLAGLLVAVGGGLVGCLYGGSVGRHREANASTALHWHVMRALLLEGACTYDLRGVADTLDPQDPTFGVLRFKLGTGGAVVEQVGDWDLVLSASWSRVLDLAQRARPQLLALRRAARVVRGWRPAASPAARRAPRGRGR